MNNLRKVFTKCFFNVSGATYKIASVQIAYQSKLIMGATFSTDSHNTMAEQFVTEKINGHKVVVFSKTYCGYCAMAKQSLTEVGAQFEVIELDRRKDGNAIQDYLYDLTGGRSVPRVFINGKFIGGGSETQAHQRSGELQKMING